MLMRLLPLCVRTHRSFPSCWTGYCINIAGNPLRSVSKISNALRGHPWPQFHVAPFTEVASAAGKNLGTLQFSAPEVSWLVW